jgi:hypothetical protein
MMHIEEPEELVLYLGKKVPRRGFRAYIYARDGRERIAESYDEFDLFTHTEEWFATKEEAITPKKQAVEEPKESIKPRKKTEG